MFRARHNADFKTLRVLHPKFIGVGNYSAALLCLDPAFIPALPLHGTPAVDPGPELSFHFAYFELLDRLRREDRLDVGSIRQKVFAFQRREDDRFFIPANSFLHSFFRPKPDTVREEGGCVVTHEELRRVLDREIPDYIRLRAKQQNDAYRRRLGAAPCLTMMTRGECRRADCQYQHLRPEKITVGWFNARIRSVLTEIRILNLAGFYPKGVILCVLPMPITIPDPDLARIGIGSVSFTLHCIPRYQVLGLSQHSTSGTRPNRRKGSGFCRNGSGRRVTSFCSAHQLRGTSISKPLSPSLCLFARWHTTSILSGHKDMSPARGCVDGGDGRCALLAQDLGWRVTLLSGTSFSFYRVVPTIH